MALTELTKVTGPGIHTLSNVLSHNIKSSGIITATKFSGPLDSIGGNFAGVITATSANFTGNVSIGGTLTYEDVTNIDSVGIITARDGLKILGGGANIVGVVTATGADINGDLDVDGHTNLDNVSVAGVTTFSDDVTFTTANGNNIVFDKSANDLTFGDNVPLYFGASNDLAIYHDTSVSRILDSYGHLLINSNIIELKNQASSKSYFSAVNGSYTKLFYDGIEKFTTASSGINVSGTTTSTQLAVTGISTFTGNIDANGDLDVDGHTNLDNVSVAGVSTFTGNLTVQNASVTDTKIIIKSTGTNSYPAFRLENDARAYDLGIDGATDAFRIYDVTGTAERLKIKSDGKVLITNTLGLGGATSNPSELLHAQTASGEAKIVVMGATTGTVAISGLNGASRVLFGDSSTENAGNITYTHSSDSLSFRVNGNTRWKFDSSGHFLPDSVGSYNIGSASAEIGDVYIADNKRLYVGSGQEASLYHNGSNTYFKGGADAGLMSIEGQGNVELFAYSSVLLRVNAGESAVICNNNSSVDLYYDGGTYTTPKLKTSATGITVTGEVAASQDYPNIQPTLDFNFAAVKKLDPRIAYQRTGPASFTDEFGKLVLVGGNVPRFDHDPTTRECKGLLIEESRTNYVRVSTNMASEWASGGGSFAVDNAITNPDGSVGAYYHTGAELYHQNIDLSGASTNVITVSLWVKERSGQSGNLDIEIFQQISGGAISMGVWSFNPTTEAISTVPSTYSDGKVVEYPNGWYRVSAKATTASGNFSSTTRFDMQSSEHYVWGMQLEVGAFPTSFIPTNGAIATRGDDDLIIDGEDLTDFHNQPEGTIIADYKVIAGHPEIFYLSDNSSSKRIGLYEAGSSQTRFIIGNSGTQADTTDSAGTTVGDNIKSAGAYKLNDVAASKNGVISSTDSSVTIPDGIDRAYIGGYYNGTVEGALGLRRLVYYQQRLPNSQLVTLTA